MLHVGALFLVLCSLARAYPTCEGRSYTDPNTNADSSDGAGRKYTDTNADRYAHDRVSGGQRLGSDGLVAASLAPAPTDVEASPSLTPSPPPAESSIGGSALADEPPVVQGKHEVPPSPDTAESAAASPSPAPIDDSSSARTASAPPSGGGDCKCGYTLSAHSNAYFPSAHIHSFASLPAGGRPVTKAQLAEAGFDVNDAWQMGGVGEDGTVSWGSLNALSGVDGALALTVKGGQPRGGRIEAAEIIFRPEGGMTNGVFTMEAQFDPTPGTCQAMFTYNLLQGQPGDEQDIEILGQTIFGTMDNGTPPGIQLTNWDIGDEDPKSDHTIVPFVADSTTSFHNYTIAWLPGQTSYYMDGQALKSSSKYFSINPNALYINHWSNGDKGFTQGPPTKDVVMKVKSVAFYYAQTGKEGLPAGCTKEQACVV